MDEEINEKEVTLKLSMINSYLSRMVELVQEAIKPGYIDVRRSIPLETDLKKAIQNYNKTYKEMREIGRDFPEKTRGSSQTFS